MGDVQEAAVVKEAVVGHVAQSKVHSIRRGS
jgi:hypothetical protein